MSPPSLQTHICYPSRPKPYPKSYSNPTSAPIHIPSLTPISNSIPDDLPFYPLPCVVSSIVIIIIVVDYCLEGRLAGVVWARTADPPAGQRRARDALQCALQILPVVVIGSRREINRKGIRLGGELD